VHNVYALPGYKTNLGKSKEALINLPERHLAIRERSGRKVLKLHPSGL
jgi:hypothetical protein